MANTHEEAARVFKALGDPNRLAIIEMLRGGERCACMLLEELHITQPTLSHHMKTLCESGVVNCRREGKWMHYSLSQKGCGNLNGLLHQMLEGAVLLDMEKTCDCQ